MQQLYQVAKQRYSILLNTNTKQGYHNSNKYRQMREDQKQRCEKQSWLLSMIRSKKRQLTPELKKSIYNYSYAIMRVVDRQFTMNPNSLQGSIQILKNQSIQTQQNFLNSLVCLYTKFFDKFQQRLSFKVKIKSFLRPTNHNVINDLIKYLIDFCRDYCQYLIYMQIKNNQQQQIQKNKCVRQIKQQDQQHNQQQSKILQKQPRSKSTNPKSINFPNKKSIMMVNSTKLFKDQDLKSKKNPISSLSTHIPNSEQDNNTIETSLNTRKKQYQKIYGIMDVTSFNNFVYMDKNKTNIDVIKLKMNQMYRDLKFRNNLVKGTIQQYYNKYYPGKNHQLQKQYIVEDTSTYISYPFAVSIAVQKNGFSCLNLNLASQQRNDRSLSPLKDHKLRSNSLSNRQSINYRNKNDFLLGSLKVLRVSEGSLPPIQQPNINTEYRSSTKLINKYSNFPMLLDNFQNKKPRNQRMNTSTLAEKQGRQPTNLKTQKNQNQYKKTASAIQSINLEHEAGVGSTYYSYNYSYNQQYIRQAQRKKIQKKRISDIRRHFTSEQKMKNSKKKLNDPEQKLVEWLDKINMMKQLQKKKILGLH